MDNELTSFTFVHSVPLREVAARLGLAILLGAGIGIDREFRNRPAGLRTHILVTLAAAMFTVITFELFMQLETREGRGSLDAIRIIEAVTAGVAFLAAGAIIQSRGNVRGLTTGASMWLAGAVGVASGAGFLFVAVAGTVLAIIVLAVLGRLEHRYLDKGGDGDGKGTGHRGQDGDDGGDVSHHDGRQGHGQERQ